MILSKLAELIESAVYGYPPPEIINMCGHNAEYYEPYYYLMYLLAKEVQVGDIVELGVAKGRGISSFAYGNPDVKVIGFDNNVSPIYTPPNVEFHLMSALPVPDFIGDIAILHCDTEHSYATVQSEFGQYKPHLLSGSVVMFDDLHAQEDGVLQAFMELPFPKIQEDRLHPANGYGVMIYE